MDDNIVAVVGSGLSCASGMLPTTVSTEKVIRNVAYEPSEPGEIIAGIRTLALYDKVSGAGETAMVPVKTIVVEGRKTIPLAHVENESGDATGKGATECPAAKSEKPPSKAHGDQFSIGDPTTNHKVATPDPDGIAR